MNHEADENVNKTAEVQTCKLYADRVIRLVIKLG